MAVSGLTVKWNSWNSTVALCVFRAECGQAMCEVSEGGLSVSHGTDDSTGQCGVGTERAEGCVLQRGSQQLLCRGGALEVWHCQVCLSASFSVSSLLKVKQPCSNGFNSAPRFYILHQVAISSWIKVLSTLFCNAKVSFFNECARFSVHIGKLLCNNVEWMYKMFSAIL